MTGTCAWRHARLRPEDTEYVGGGSGGGSNGGSGDGMSSAGSQSVNIIGGNGSGGGNGNGNGVVSGSGNTAGNASGVTSSNLMGIISHEMFDGIVYLHVVCAGESSSKWISLEEAMIYCPSGVVAYTKLQLAEIYGIPMDVLFE
ncbi:uncharacterized protein Dsimw501_GD26802 [Drosophila simulans]|nr:uncharacterized protein Dsimw501_GD26802 [Drosophila simulans]